MGRYGKNMRDCCDSVADPKHAHVKGCPRMNAHTDAPADDLVERLAFFADGKRSSIETKSQRAEARKAMRAGLARIRSLEAQVTRWSDQYAAEVERHGETFEAKSQAEAQRDEAVGLATELANDLEAEITARSSGELPRRIARDMEIVVRFRAFLDSLKEGRT